MQITFLYYEDCPSHDAALERLKKVLADESIHVDIEVVRVETEEQAQALRFVGSPTIRINGEDIDPPAPGAYYNLTCRVYWREDGRASPLPPVEMIRRAVLQNAARA